MGYKGSELSSQSSEERRREVCMILEVLKNDAEPLRCKSVPTLITEGVRDLVRDMKETMLSMNGIGLAAPQVGVNLRVIVIQTMKVGKMVGPVQEMINPVITSFSKDSVEYEEGCLSIPGEYIKLERPFKIHIKFQDLSGKYKKWSLKGLEARIVQHEIDHLDGILMSDYNK